jgi:hypothetical protein
MILTCVWVCRWQPILPNPSFELYDWWSVSCFQLGLNWELGLEMMFKLSVMSILSFCWIWEASDFLTTCSLSAIWNYLNMSLHDVFNIIRSQINRCFVWHYHQINWNLHVAVYSKLQTVVLLNVKVWFEFSVCLQTQIIYELARHIAHYIPSRIEAKHLVLLDTPPKWNEIACCRL